MRKLRLKPELIHLLTSRNWDNFTNVELSQAYQQLPNLQEITQKQAQQFIFRNLSRMVREGLVIQSKGKTCKDTRYTLTFRFLNGDYSEGTPHCKVNEVNIAPTTPPSISLKLKEQLNRYRVDLTTSLAEVDEYEHLSRLEPSIQTEIQELYNDARNRCSKLLGRLRAIESLITKIQVS